MSLKELVKSQCFFTDHLKHVTVNKTACRMPSANLRTAICASVRGLYYCSNYFLRLSGSPDLFGKLFLADSFARPVLINKNV